MLARPRVKVGRSEEPRGKGRRARGAAARARAGAAGGTAAASRRADDDDLFEESAGAEAPDSRARGSARLCHLPRLHPARDGGGAAGRRGCAAGDRRRRRKEAREVRGRVPGAADAVGRGEDGAVPFQPAPVPGPRLPLSRHFVSPANCGIWAPAALRLRGRADMFRDAAHPHFRATSRRTWILS